MRNQVSRESERGLSKPEAVTLVIEDQFFPILAPSSLANDYGERKTRKGKIRPLDSVFLVKRITAYLSVH